VAAAPFTLLRAAERAQSVAAVRLILEPRGLFDIPYLLPPLLPQQVAYARKVKQGWHL
jgi:hypothetical protein